MSGPLFLLGPQRPHENLSSALERIRALPGADGPVLTITAGWRHDEAETKALHDVVGDDVVHLPLYQWFEQCMEDMPDLRQRYRERQRALIDVKELYRVRLQHALDAVRDLTFDAADGNPIALKQFDFAVDDVQRIDRQFVDHSRLVAASFADVARPWDRPEVARRRAESAQLFAQAKAVLIAGGHVAVLRNRMMFFGVHQQLYQAWLQQTAVVAWGAGAMVLTDPIVLFYDDPPDGPSHPEILDSGLALVQDSIVLPDAEKRLRLTDRMRVRLLAGRFGRHQCIALENGAFLEKVDGAWLQRGRPGSASVLHATGDVVAMQVTP